jgi:hypothetical protein
VALRDRAGEIVATEKWSPGMYSYAEKTLRNDVLGGLGDPKRERTFRMCITLCIHRGLGPRELRRLPRWWHEAPARDMAGGPLEIISSRGVPDIASARPCINPVRRPIDPRRPDLYLPMDCERCEPCRARKALEREP